jgi:hypothetical protein
VRTAPITLSTAERRALLRMLRKFVAGVDNVHDRGVLVALMNSLELREE